MFDAHTFIIGKVFPVARSQETAVAEDARSATVSDINGLSRITQLNIMYVCCIVSDSCIGKGMASYHGC